MSFMKKHASGTLDKWDSINWITAQNKVKQLQQRIVKAVEAGKYRKVKSLQYLLTNSFYAKALAIKRVTQNKGKNTPGVDGVKWTSSKQKMTAILSLSTKGYKAKPLRRVNIPKSNGKTRPLGIPTMKDRAMQALYLMALIPVAEATADVNSYGFRPKRSCADAIEQCFNVFSRKQAAQWVLEADIKGCFDNISHQWILDNIPLDKKVLRQWLKAGIIENNCFSSTKRGTPQGGIISPTIANMVLDGLEHHILDACGAKPYKSGRRNERAKQLKINFIRYADDFVVSANSKAILKEVILPAVIEFLAPRGLQIQKEKTKITHIHKGFDFLGQNVRKYGDKLLIKPSHKSIKSIKRKVFHIIKKHRQAPTIALIVNLNPIIKGWANYHQHIVAKDTFTSIDSYIFQRIWQWAKRRHNNKSATWIKNKYFNSYNNRNWVFAQQVAGKLIKLSRMENVVIKRHIKIRADANPFKMEHQDYFDKRSYSRVR